MGDAWSWIAWIFGAYLLGSIPFAYVIGKSRGIDIREHGSRNVGASNVGRVLGRKFGMLCFVLDVGKGLVPTLVSGFTQSLIVDLRSPGTSIDGMHQLLWILVGAAAVVGHTNSIFLGFKGGKGVATAFGAMLGLYPYLTFPVIGAMAVWLAVVRLTRFISLASMIAVSSVPLWFLVTMVQSGGASENNTAGYWVRVANHWPFLVVTVLLALFVIWKHRANIARLRAGTETHVGQSKQAHEHPGPPRDAS